VELLERLSHVSLTDRAALDLERRSFQSGAPYRRNTTSDRTRAISLVTIAEPVRMGDTTQRL